MSGGFLGVDVFFVLSGFLITSLLTAEISATGTISLGNFYLRRLQRLYPPMLVFLLAYVVLAPYFWQTLSKPWVHAGVAAVYMTDYANVLKIEVGQIGHLWSLAAEWKFYLIWPLILLFIVTRRNPLFWIAFLILIATSWRFLGYFKGYSWSRLYYCTDTHASGLMVGSGLAMLLKRFPANFSGVMGAVGAGVVLYSAFTFDWMTKSSTLYGGLVVELASCMLILSALSGKGWLASKPMALLGRYSYGLYLWHMPIMIWFRNSYEWPVTLIAGGSLGLLASMASYHSVEGYFRRLKKKRPYAESPSLTEA
jgi:peptidoglycan/LPS O-acetylase OafA/YrhL